MATTTNFGWETPDDTDLVKDGAAAIRTALGGVDTSFVDLKGGTTNQILAKNSNTDLDFKWVSDVNGKVLQVVNAIYGTDTTSTSSTFADTGITATITPTSATSKILVSVTIPVYKDTTNTNGEFKLVRTSTTIATMSNVAYNGATTGIDIGTTSINYLDSPATTSATVYKVQFASQANSSRVVVCRGGGQTNQASITLMEIGA
jgi:hypothetical protein